jgi:RNA polymerase sigma factor (sigma-70 family)
LNQKDRKYLEGIIKRDSAVINNIYEEYYPSIERHISKNSGNKSDAIDIFHDALIVLYGKVTAPDFQLTSSLHTYLFSIVKYLWYKKLGRRSKYQKVTNAFHQGLSHEQSLDDKMEHNDRFDLYREKFALLDSKCQKCLSLFFMGKNMVEIANEMGWGSEGYARKKKFKCKEKLIEMIKSDPRFNELKD